MALRSGDERAGSLVNYVGLDDRAGKDHPQWTIRSLVNEALFTLSPVFSAMYMRIGRPSILLWKLLRKARRSSNGELRSVNVASA